MQLHLIPSFPFPCSPSHYLHLLSGTLSSLAASLTVISSRNYGSVTRVRSIPNLNRSPSEVPSIFFDTDSKLSLPSKLQGYMLIVCIVFLQHGFWFLILFLTSQLYMSSKPDIFCGDFGQEQVRKLSTTWSQCIRIQSRLVGKGFIRPAPELSGPLLPYSNPIVG